MRGGYFFSLKNARSADTQESRAVAESWLDHRASSLSGSGTADDPITISSAEELAYLSYSVRSGERYASKYIKQVANIDLGGYNWMPIGTKGNYFQGTYDGNNYNISSLFLTGSSGDPIGLFSDIQWGGTVKNVTLKNSIIRYTGQKDSIVSGVGSIVGLSDNDSRVENCCSNAVIICENVYAAGGIVGHLWGDNSRITGCYFSGDVQNTANQVGGITGRSSGGIVTKCINRGYVKGYDQVGGIVGHAEKTISIDNCVNYARVEGEHYYAGGITGILYTSPIEDCSNFGNVRGNLDVGGIAGEAADGSIIKTSISDCVIEGSGFVGAISGQAHSNVNISNCSVYGLLYSYDEGSTLHGLVGRLAISSTIENCCFVGGSNKVVSDIYTDTSSSDYQVFSCYVFANNIGYYSTGDFSGWALCGDMNNGLPMQKVLYHVAQFGNGVEAAWFESKGFEKV